MKMFLLNKVGDSRQKKKRENNIRIKISNNNKKAKNVNNKPQN